MMVCLAHCGQGRPLARHPVQCSMPYERPRLVLLYAQVIKVYRRRRIVRVQHCVVFDTP
jgi:hypothetical protein